MSMTQLDDPFTYGTFTTKYRQEVAAGANVSLEMVMINDILEGGGCGCKDGVMLGHCCGMLQTLLAGVITSRCHY